MKRTIKDKAWWSLYNMGLDAECPKSKVVKYARKMVENGLLSDGELNEIIRMGKDKDLCADDLISELQSYCQE
jgi:hypothetical protein